MKVIGLLLCLSSASASLLRGNAEAEPPQNNQRRVEFRHEKFTGRHLYTDDHGTVRVMIRFNGERGKELIRQDSIKQGADLTSISTLAVTVDLNHLLQLADDDDILEIMEDAVVRAASETIPYGVELAQFKPPGASFMASSSSSCSDPNSFKIAVVDSGANINHPDMPCQNMGSSSATCMGQSFSGDSWDNPSYYHGMHVAGTMAARGYNNEGIVGMMGSDSDFCLIIARVLDDSGNGYMSDVLNGVQWAADMGAKVINMSIVGGDYSSTHNDMYQAIYDRNILVVAAAGNDGSNSYSYPASYSSVVSVAAIDQDLQRASFSQTNNEITLAAPGYQILSTAPQGRGYSIATISIGSDGFAGKWLERSRLPSGPIMGNFVECSNGGLNGCDNVQGQICVIERIRKSYEKAARACQEGGAAAVVFLWDTVRLSGGLKSTTSVTIPAAIIDLNTGRSILNMGQPSASLEVSDGYMFLDGTSMASPHVAGAAAAIWKACPSCNNADVLDCLEHTAKDLGDQGRDNEFGAGLVQEQDAYNCLRGICC